MKPMTDEYIRKQDAIDVAREDGKKIPTVAIRIMHDIKALPPADVAPVVHGKWTRKPDVYGVVYCSECDYELHANSTSFCPNCGAKMDREE